MSNNYHCSIYAIQGVDIPKTDLGPFKTLGELVRTTGKPYDQWKREQSEVKKIVSVRQPKAGHVPTCHANIFADF
jgi:hypothetical protein